MKLKPQGKKSKQKSIRRMKINIIILQAEGSDRPKEGKKEGQKCKRVFLEVGGKMYMPFGLH